MAKNIKIQNKTIGNDCSPFIVAELSGNGNQDLERTLKIVQSAYDCGADALKIQTYDENTITLNSNLPDFIINNPKSLWANKKLYDLYKEAKTPRDFHKPIFDKCKELGLICFSTPFHESDVDYLEQNFNPDIYKIASFELVHTPLLKYVAQTKKPVILSTGMASYGEISDAVFTLRDGGVEDIVLLKCVSAYPADAKNYNLKTIPSYKEDFNVLAGLSDHTIGTITAIASVALGASVIEKHFTLNRLDGGVDSAFSAQPDELKQLIIECKTAHSALGCVNYSVTEDEEKSLMFRRSVYAVKNINKDEQFTKDNIKIIRPGFGIEPKYYSYFINKKCKFDIVAGTPIHWYMI